jgi:WASH complex subunit strumpellin
MDFNLSDCSRAAKIICSSGSAIIAELMRLKNYIPDVFLFKVIE